MAKGNKVTKGNKKVTTQMLVNIEDMKNFTLLPFKRMKMSFLLIIDFGLLIGNLIRRKFCYLSVWAFFEER